MNIYSTRKLGKVEQEIVRQLGAQVDTSFVAGLPPADELWHHHSSREDFMPRRELYFACGAAFAGSSARAAQASFSRALHSLFDKGLLCGLALAWIYVEKDADGRWEYDELHNYAGGGRRGKDARGYPDKAPVLSMVGLTEAGFDIARQMDPAAGLGCPQCRQIVERDGMVRA